MARERKMTVDEKGFNESMEKQKLKAKEAGRFNQGKTSLSGSLFLMG
ncbi:hypothetical protein Ct9H90mP29_05480 [bacterium]|nr:MAG: hypothetical protein Ct9H90mP29_05480 [bacterium]